MGRRKQLSKPAQKKPISIPPGKKYCRICEVLISIAKGGVCKHKNGPKHQGNLLRIEAEHAEEAVMSNFLESSSDDSESDDIHDTRPPRRVERHHQIPPVTEPIPDEQFLGIEDHELAPDVSMESVEDRQPESDTIFLNGPPDFQLDRNKIYIEMHPFSKSVTSDPSTPPASDLPLHWPFNTQEDFLQAELCIDSLHDMETIDRQLKLNHQLQAASVSKPCTLHSAKEMMETLDRAAVFDEEKFQKHTVSTKFDDKSYKYSLYLRDLQTTICELLADPDFKDLLVFDPERHYISRPNGEGHMRVYEEYHHGDDFWEIRSALGPHSSPIILSLYADETQLTAFGNVSLWTVYVTICNLPRRIRNSRGKGGPTLIAVLPKAEHPPDITKAQLADFRCKLYQDCWRVILHSIQDSSHFGDMYQLGSGEFRHCTTLVGIKAVDYPEMCRMECNIGKDGPCGCVVCMAPSKEFHDIRSSWPERDPNLASKAIENALSRYRSTTIPTPKSLGLRPVMNAFVSVTNRYFATHKTIGADGLHHFFSGEYGRHWLPSLLTFLPDSLTRKIDGIFAELPRYPDLPHFKKGFTSLKWRSGSDNKTIALLLTPVLDAVLPSKLNKRRSILQLFRLLGEFAILIRFTQHTDVTLERMRGVLDRMSHLQEELAETFEENLNTPKHHYVHQHFIDSICAKGPISNTDTGFGESMHPQSKQDYAKSNRQEGKFEMQILAKALRRHSICRIRALLDAAADSENGTSTRDETAPTDLNVHVQFGSPISRMQHIDELLGALATSLQQDQTSLMEILQRFLYHHLKSLQVPGVRKPRKDHLPIVGYYKVRVHKLARIRYVSLQDNSLQTDLIRVTDDWRKSGNARNDFVIVNLNYELTSCAQVHLLFVLNIEGRLLHIALIRILKAVSRNSTTGYIHASESTEYNYPRYVLNDLVDPDMYLRLTDM